MSLEFSIIIATYARPHEIQACLQSLQRLASDSPCHEAIVVDDGSPHPLDPATLPAGVRLLRQPNAGAAAARNRGARSARGRRLVFLDDDCHVPTDWLQRLERACHADPQAMIGGRTVNALTDNVYAVASQCLVDVLYQNLNARGAAFFAGNNLCVTSEPFRQLGGFDPSFTMSAGEDRDLCARWSASGRPLHYAPEVHIEHHHKLSLVTFFRQHYGYGRAARVLAGKKVGWKLRRTAFYTALLRAALRHRQTLPVLALLGLSQLATAAGYLYQQSLPRQGRGGASAPARSR